MTHTRPQSINVLGVECAPEPRLDGRRPTEWEGRLGDALIGVCEHPNGKWSVTVTLGIAQVRVSDWSIAGCRESLPGAARLLAEDAACLAKEVCRG